MMADRKLGGQAVQPVGSCRLAFNFAGGEWG